jgi:hypothetical protein
VTAFLDTASNFHPYECDGPGHCIHCDRLVSETHDPGSCALCETTLWFQADDQEVDVSEETEATEGAEEDEGGGHLEPPFPPTESDPTGRGTIVENEIGSESAEGGPDGPETNEAAEGAATPLTPKPPTPADPTGGQTFIGNDTPGELATEKEEADETTAEAEEEADQGADADEDE